MKKLLFGMLLLVGASFASAQTFPVNNLVVNGASSFAGVVSGPGFANLLAPYAALTGATFTGPVAVNDPAGTSASTLRVAAVNGSTGSNLVLVGNGSTTPAKTIRVVNGSFQILNNAQSAQIFTLSDIGALGTFTINTTGPITTGATTYYPTVANNAALTALSTAATPIVTRLGFYSAGDSPAVTYSASGSACSLNSGAGDTGSQVRSANNLCWLGSFPATGADIRQFGAKVDGTTDDSAAVQFAINYESTTGGIVLFPAGTTQLNTGVVVTIGGVTIKGIGWQEYSGTESSGTPGPNSSWILSTSAAASPLSFANTVENARLLDIGFRQTQPADTAGWTPTVYPPSINIVGGNFSSGAVDIENVFCWQCYSFISMGATGNFVGRITMKHVWGQPLSSGITITAASDTVLMDDIHFWPFATASTNIFNWVLAHGTAFNFLRADNPMLLNTFVFGYNIGLLFSSSTDGSSQHFQISNFGCDSCNQGIIFNEGANGANGQINNFYVQAPNGTPNTSNGLTVNSGVTGLTVDITNFRASNMGGSCMSLGGASDISSVNTWCDAWNTSNTSVAGLVAGTSNLLTLGGRLRFNGGGGAAQTGGAGIINQTHVN